MMKPLPKAEHPPSLADRDVLITPATPDKFRPGPHSVWTAQLSVAIIQVLFVVGSVYLKVGTKHMRRGEVFNPIVYALAREAIAGPILLLLAYVYTGTVLPERRDLPRLLALGSCLFGSQLFYVAGIKLSGVVVATCMQPAIPVFTVALSILTGLETATPSLVSGIALAVVGAMAMVIGGATAAPATTAAAALSPHMFLGNAALLINTLSMACYYLVGKTVVAKYPPLAVAAWAYLVAASLMACAATVYTVPADWNFPRSLLAPLAYWIVVCSVAGYGVVTWAMTKLPPSQVASFQCLQPPIGTALALMVLGEAPKWWDLGAIGVIGGLFLVVYKDKDKGPKEGGTGRSRRWIKAMSGYRAVKPV